jgi:hypothetical protein
MAKKTTKTYTGRDYVAMREYVAGKGGAHKNYRKYDRKAYTMDADFDPNDPTLLINILKDE